MAVYNVTAGKDRATIELTEETKIVFSFSPNVIAVKAVGGSVLVSLDQGAQEGDDGASLIADGESTLFMPFADGEIYVSGEATVEVWAGRSGNEVPLNFRKGAKGGGSGGGCNYKGTTTTAIENGSTTNPITIDGESYTAIFGDVVVYNYTEFVFDGTQWSEFGRPFDTTPTSGSANAVTSDGIASLIKKGAGINSSIINNTVSNVASANNSLAVNTGTVASANGSFAAGNMTTASQPNMMAIGKYNSPRSNDLFNIGNGTSTANRSNILEVNSTEMNINGDIQQNGVPLRATTMPTITASMLGKVVQYVGVSDSNYKQGWNYVAVSDGAAEPTYSWQALMDSTPKSDSANAITSGGIYTLIHKGTGTNSVILNQGNTSSNVHTIAGGYHTSASGQQSTAFGNGSIASGTRSFAVGYNVTANQPNMTAIGKYNAPRANDLFNIGNGTADNARSNILEVNSTELNVNGDIQRNGVGIDDYTTTERKIGKWIDGSDLYQRTFEVTGLVNGQWNNNILGTSGINIVDVQGWIDWTYNSEPNCRTNLNYYSNPTDYIGLQNTYNDLSIKPDRTGDTGMLITEAVITIKYTKPSAQSNLMQMSTPTEEVSETPTVEEDDMR